MRPEINYYSRADARGYAGRESVLPEARDLGGRTSVRPNEGGFVPLRQPSVRPEVYAYRTPSAQAGYERGGLNVAPQCRHPLSVTTRTDMVSEGTRGTSALIGSLCMKYMGRSCSGISSFALRTWL